MKKEQLSKTSSNPFPTFTVGISSRSGGDSLLHTAKTILASKNVKKFQFIIIADGDPVTAKITKEFKTLGITFIQNKTDGSLHKKLNQMLKLVKTDLFIFTQDDITFHPHAISHIVDAFVKDSLLTMTSARVLPLKPLTFFESIMGTGIRIHDRIARSWNGTDNYLAASGRCLAFRTKHLKKFRIPEKVVNGDAYLFAENKRLGGTFTETTEAKVFIRCPQTLKEQLGPSKRYQYSKKELEKYFKHSLDDMYAVPSSVIFRAFLGEFVSHPITAKLYLGVFVITRLLQQSQKTVANTQWDVEQSTKKVADQENI